MKRVSETTLLLLAVGVLGAGCADILGYRDSILGDTTTGAGGSGGQGGNTSAAGTAGSCTEDDGKECTEDMCDGATPKHIPKPEKTPCSQNGGAVCNSNGNCVECVDNASCTAPATCGSGAAEFTCQCAAPCPIWANNFGNQLQQQGTVVAITNSGNVVLAGNYQGDIDLGGSTLAATPLGSIYVAQFSSSGVHAWSKTFGGTGSVFVQAIADDNLGNTLVAGYYLGTLNFGGADLTATNGSSDIFLLKLDASGNHVWSMSFGSPFDETCLGVATNSGGDVAITGWFRDTINFGGGNLTASGIYGDVFVAKFNPGGSHLWSERFGDDQNQVGNAIAMDVLGNVYVAGHFSSTLSFGGGTLSLASEGASDAFVAKLDSSGTPMWANRYGDANDQVASSVAVDGAGNVVIAGNFQGTVEFGPSNCQTLLSSQGANDVFVTHLYPAGNCQWAKRFGGGDQQYGTGLAVDGNNNVYVVGSLGNDAVDFGFGPVTGSGFLLKQDPMGATIWAKGIENTSLSYAAHNAGFLAVSGALQGTVDLGLGPLTSAGQDAFVGVFKP